MTPFLLLLLVGVAAMLLPTILFGIVSSIHDNRAKALPKPKPKRNLKPADELTQAVETITASLRGAWAPEVGMKLDRLRKNVAALSPRLSGLGPSTYHTVFSTGTRYLPDAVKAYQSLPSGARDTDLVDGQKTAKNLLCDQLDIMNSELEKVLAEAQKVDATDLIVHGRFLEEKYGKAEPVVENVPKASALSLGSKIKTGSPGRGYEISGDGFKVLAFDGSVVAEYPRAGWSKGGDLRVVEPIPAGEYDVEVVDAESKYSKAGRQMIELKLVVTSGQYGGRKLWKNLVIPESARGMDMLFSQVSALGVPPVDWDALRYAGTETLMSMFLGRRATAHVRIGEYQGVPRNQVDFLTPARVAGTVDA